MYSCSVGFALFSEVPENIFDCSTEFNKDDYELIFFSYSSYAVYFTLSVDNFAVKPCKRSFDYLMPEDLSSLREASGVLLRLPRGVICP